MAVAATGETLGSASLAARQVSCDLSDFEPNAGAKTCMLEDPIAGREAFLRLNALVLEKLSRGDSVKSILDAVLAVLRQHYPEVSAAALLAQHADGRLQVGASCNLPDGCVQAVASVADWTSWAGTSDAAGPAEAVSVAIATTLCEREIRSQAERHELSVLPPVPIRSANGRVLGFFVLFAEEGAVADTAARSVLDDLSALIAFAVEQEALRFDGAALAAQRSENEKRITLAIAGSGTGIWDRHVPSGTIYYSAAWKALLGYAESEVTNRIEDSYTRVHPDDIDGVKATIQAHLDGKTEDYRVEHRVRCKDGSYKWICSRGRVVERDRDGNAVRMIGTTTDATLTRMLSDKLQQSAELVKNLTNEVPGLVFQYQCALDGGEGFSYASRGIQDIYGLTPEQVLQDASLIRLAIHPEDWAAYRSSLDQSASDLTPWHVEYRVLLPGQDVQWRQGDALPQRMPNGSVVWHGFITDVTRRKEVEAALQQLATVDFLTQLPNRGYFINRLEEELARLKRNAHAPSALLMFDLDHFKSINDRYGHGTGDSALKHFAGVLKGELRKIDVGGRIGGEEFAVLLSGAGTRQALIFAERVQRHLANAALRQDGKPIALTVSIGITALDVNDTGIEQALCRSDAALYRAKEKGRDRIECSAEPEITVPRV
jgi:diguanylate cyclase (GGDEF)-like protein/PAS domain S-box-containing protein